jgi:hypothetical protein
VEYHQPSLHTQDPVFWASEILYSHTVGDGQLASLEVFESGYFTDTEVSPVHRNLGFPRSTSWETLSLRPLRKLIPHEDLSVVACRRLFLYSRYPRARRANDLAVAWRCFAWSNGGKEAAFANYLEPGLVQPLKVTQPPFNQFVFTKCYVARHLLCIPWKETVRLQHGGY